MTTGVPSLTHLVLVAVVAGLLVPGAAPVTAAADGGFVYITTATTPDQPTTTGNFTLTTTLRSAEASDTTYRIDRIELWAGPHHDPDFLLEKTFVGRANPSLPPDGSVVQNFSIGFDTPGTHEVNLRLRLDGYGTDPFTITQPVDVRVYQPNPRLEASVQPAVPGERTNLTVDIANGMDQEIRDIRLELDAPGVDLAQRRRIASSLASGATHTFAFSAVPEELGDHQIRATLEYTNASGTHRRLRRTLDVTFRPPDLSGRVDVAAEVAPTIAGTETSLNLSLTNGHDRDLRQLAVTIEGPDLWVKEPRRIGTQLDSGDERTFSFTVKRPDAGPQPVEATITYTTVNGVEGQLTRTLSTAFTEPANPGEIRLTGVNAIQRGNDLEISATASNVGSSDVTGVVVTVPAGTDAAPADYFVGGVDASDFASFTLTSTARGNLSSVPLEISYVVDGTRQTYTTEVPVDRVPSTPTGQPGGGLPWLPIAGGVIVLLLVVVGYLRWR